MVPTKGTKPAFNQRALFRSTRSDDLLPHQHRSSVVGAEDRQRAGRSLTQSLLDSHPEQFKAATQTPFLQHAGAGKVSKVVLSKWLSQDRLYAEAYICLITSLIARVNLPYAFVSDKSKSLRWRILKMLTGALENIHREIDFFTSTAEQYGLRLDLPPEDGHEDSDEDGQMFMPNHATQQYIDLFRGFFSEPASPLLEGMVVLWATERCYLSAWTYASQFLDQSGGENDADNGALRKHFIPNWTSKEFHGFVDEIAELTDMLAVREQAEKKREVYKAVWSHILDIEQRFWPEVDST